MSRTTRDLAMLAEMGLHWPEPLEGSVVPRSDGSTPAEGMAGPPAPASAPATALASTPASASAPAMAMAMTSTSAPAPAPAAEPPPISLQASPLSRLDWAGLQQAVVGCQACALSTSRRQTVFGVGSPTARWMVIGEAPGEQEDRQGEPFVGPAGQLLDRMLAAIGLDRGGGSVFITNTIKCRPPQNRNPQPEELQACSNHLARQLELVQPQIILALGRFAAQQLLRTDQPLGRLRGQLHPLPGRPEVPVVVTYHPAYLLRYPIDKAKAWADLCLAVDALKT